MSPLRMPRPTRRRGTDCFWFRRRVHKGERPFVLGRPLVVRFPATANDPAFSAHVARIGNEINFSLRTRDRATAEARHGIAMATIRSYFRSLKEGQRQLTHQQIVALSGEIYRLFVNRFQENPGDPETWAAVKAMNRAAREGRLLARMTSLRPAQIDDAREILADLFPDLTASINALARATSDDKRVAQMEERFGFLADWVLALHGINTDAKSRTVLLHHVDLASTDAFWFLKGAASGNYTPDKNADRFPPLHLDATPQLTWDALFANWENVHKAKEGAETIRRQWRSILNHFSEFSRERGKFGPSEITSSDVRAWRDQLLSEKRSPVTVQDSYLAALRRIYAVAVSEELLASNPALGVRIEHARRRARRMRGFTQLEAATILDAASHETCPLRRWVPWLTAFTGSRVQEIISLDCNDVKLVDGTWCIQIEKAKTRASERIVPIHPAIIRQGFLQYVQDRISGPIFVERRTSRRGLIKRLRRWLHSIERLQLGREHNVAPNHGWRHWFKTVAREAGVEDSVIDAIVGHAPASVGGRYGSVTVRTMAQALEKIPVPCLRSR